MKDRNFNFFVFLIIVFVWKHCRVRRLSSTKQEQKVGKKYKDTPKSTKPDNIYEIAFDDNSGYQELEEFNNISTYDKLR